jgi:hypothetical protein
LTSQLKHSKSAFVPEAMKVSWLNATHLPPTRATIRQTFSFGPVQSIGFLNPRRPQEINQPQSLANTITKEIA